MAAGRDADRARVRRGPLAAPAADAGAGGGEEVGGGIIAEAELAAVAVRIRELVGRDSPARIPLAQLSARTRYLLAQRQNRADKGK